jgi:hypothetical protein
MVVVGTDLLVVVGGCAVSVQGEMIGSNMSPTEAKALLEKSNLLQKRYLDENRAANINSLSLEMSVESGETSLKDIYHKSSNISSSFHQLESSTRVAERGLVDSWNISKANSYFNSQRAKHPFPNLDVVFNKECGNLSCILQLKERCLRLERTLVQLA